MTIEEMSSRLKSLGVSSRFVPFDDDGTLAIRTRREPTFTNGAFSGSYIHLTGSVFIVWTSKTKLGRFIAESYKLKTKRYDREMDLFVPAALADAILPRFGAKIKKTLSPEHRKRLADATSNHRFLRKSTLLKTTS